MDGDGNIPSRIESASLVLSNNSFRRGGYRGLENLTGGVLAECLKSTKSCPRQRTAMFERSQAGSVEILAFCCLLMKHRMQDGDVSQRRRKWSLGYRPNEERVHPVTRLDEDWFICDGARNDNAKTDSGTIHATVR